MTPTIIGIKELQLNLKRVADAAQKGSSFTVVRDSKPVFRIEPMPMERRIGSLEEFLQKGKFKGGPKDLSLRVDDIAYGNYR